MMGVQAAERRPVVAHGRDSSLHFSQVIPARAPSLGS